MRIRVIAVGSRTPSWVRENCEDYAARLRARLKLELVDIPSGKRGAERGAGHALRTEGARVLAALRPKEFVVALDERGEQLSSRELSAWLAARLGAGRDLAFLIGGADGLAADVLARADCKLALSRMTLPHTFARVLVVEQLYRAHSLLDHHPYHRD
ncbi:MAG TPA: 23S rRNA (pseudouridine(1915)-N(3))-methyltransferase RlmH [Steroidobacteraceae bacterium]|jgi:23S rRNA (pseudouridine1915-N3)-methyltransferase|nr:23S rRNA (pseudouridine(1915)-N(3))-methyltransferase RlmH [Steroidobacteraceae bacterium]